MKAKAKSRLGQNFLVDEQAQQQIVAALGPLVRGAVLEIGPGKAAITSLLAEQAERLIAVEVDPLLAGALGKSFANQAAIEIVVADVLSVDLTALVAGRPRSLAVIGNLPYYITSPILQHLFAHEDVLSRAVLMVQREVAERMCATPGHSEYGALSVLCQLHAQLDLLFTLPPSAFDPPPAVHSSVVRLEFKPRWAELGVERESFLRFIRVCFAQKRKTLGNNLRAGGYEPASVEAALMEPGTAARGTTRAEELSPAELVGVFRRLSEARMPATRAALPSI
ncbi:ribosomal RNA small subunit methyltransferase A [Acidipila sp. EB88]|nr:ribosomal RNA small subunit methyltransferase A [Acidipila sp. EB88]